MTLEALALAPAPGAAFPGPLPAPPREEITAAMGPMPWLTPTGRMEQIITAWGRGQLAEVPAGLAFDVLRTPGAVAEDTVRQMREAGRRIGPVIVGPSGGEFILERGSAPRWAAPRSQLLRPGTLVLLPPPAVCHPETVAARGWLVPPSHPETGAPICVEATPARALLEAYLASVQAAEAAEVTPDDPEGER